MRLLIIYWLNESMYRNDKKNLLCVNAGSKLIAGPMANKDARNLQLRPNNTRSTKHKVPYILQIFQRVLT